MPTGRVKFFDADKGFGFIAGEEGREVYLHASALPDGVTTLRSGTRVEYEVVDGRRGAQAMSVRLLDRAGTPVRNRKPADEMTVIVEDLIKLLDHTSNSLRRGRYPDDRVLGQVATVLRAVADDLEA